MSVASLRAGPFDSFAFAQPLRAGLRREEMGISFPRMI
jgi:hypothetical protein